MISNFLGTTERNVLRVQSYVIEEYAGLFKGLAEVTINGIGLLL
jgi:hypothetical protein